MLITNRNLITCPFDEYLKLPGNSYSSIKNEGVPFTKATQKMQLGTHVHNYLLTPEEYSFDDLHLVKPLAVTIKQRIGVLMRYLQPELAVTCFMQHEGFSMQYKGRIDLGIPDQLVIDIKVSEMPLTKSIPYFGYDKQLSGYALGISAKAAIIIRIHPKKQILEIKNIPISSQWWEYQIVQRGEIL